MFKYKETRNSQALTLRSGGNANPNLAVLTGSLKINGDLTVTGTISGTIDTKNITSGILSVDRIPNLSTDKITSGILTVDRIPNLSADKITSGILTVDRIPNLSADKITSGILTVDRIPNLSADKITSGILTVDRIPNLSADKITSGTITGNLTVTGNIVLSDYGKQIQLIKAVTAEGVIAWGEIRSNSYVGLQIGFPDSNFGGKLQIGTLASTQGMNFNELMAIEANGNTSIKGNLTVNGAITPSAGNAENNGIMFPKDPYGGSGDAAWIRYYSRNPNSTDAGLKEQLTLEIGIANDGNDHIALISSGGVGIGTNNPGAKLEVKGGQTKLEQEAWQTPTFLNSWVNYENTYNPAGYFKDSLGIVHLRGLVKNGTNNTTIFTLPVGYRPSNRELLTVQTYTTAAGTGNNTTGRVDILTDGTVQVIFGNNGWLSLDGLTFRAA